MSEEVKTFKLSQPLKTPKEEISELQFLYPLTARSFIDHGSPYDVSKDGIMKYNIPAILGFVADMTGVERRFLGSIAGCDVMPLTYRAMEFVHVPPPNG